MKFDVSRYTNAAPPPDTVWAVTDVLKAPPPHPHM